VDKIKALIQSQAWDGVEVDNDLPGRGRGVMATRPFLKSEVVCDYGGQLRNHKNGKAVYEASAPETMGYMFTFRHKGAPWWRDATEEKPGAGRLINHSACHANVSTHDLVYASILSSNIVL